MSGDSRPYTPGWLEFAAAGLIIALLLVFGAPSCSEKPPVGPALPPVGASPQAATATAKAKTRVTISPMQAQRPGDPTAVTPGGPADIGALDFDGDGILDSRIVIEMEVEAAATAPVLHPAPQLGPPPSTEHTRLGVGAFTMPGILAVDLQIVRGRPLMGLSSFKLLPPELEQLELSADVVANTRSAGLMAAAGSKTFVGVGYFTEFTLGNQGVFLGGGLRF